MHPRIGTYYDSKKHCHFTVWAPSAQQVTLHLEGGEQEIDLKSLPFGYWTISLPDITPGTRYRYSQDGGRKLPDPASRYQPDGVHESSAVVDLSRYEWQDQDWGGLPRNQWVIYELHVGTFTEEGTFAAVIDRLDDLQDLGINVLELMPISQFPGNRNWGYDGVYPFAAQKSYGGPVGLMALVDACHQRGMAVILDVVYNHLGPEGNYLAEYGPYFSESYLTPWGRALNFEGPQCDAVRHYYLENARMWLEDFHLDGFRLDAVHAIIDRGARHFLSELSDFVKSLSDKTRQNYTVIGECDLNDRRYLVEKAVGGYGLDAQWADEFHHSVHALLTDERSGYYSDFGTLSLLAKAYNDAFVYDGIYSPHRQRTFGSKVKDLEGDRFVNFIQNHDQVGNRMMGDRWAKLVDFETQKLAAAMLFVGPYIPLIFMGEEYGEENPFLYFVSHGDPDLVEAVRNGRQAEFSAFMGDGETPDPQSEKTFNQSKLSWDWSGRERDILRNYYKQWILWKKEHPILSQHDRFQTRAWADEARQVLSLLRGDADHQLVCWMNVGREPQTITWTENRSGAIVLNSADPVWGGPGEHLPPNINPAEPFRLEPRSVVMFELWDA